MTTRTTSLAHELKAVIRLAGRDPDALDGMLPTLSAMQSVVAAGDIGQPARVHFILHRLIPEYLQRLPGGRECRAIRELLTWQDDDGELQSLTTRYHKAAAHLVGAASDFGRRQEPRLLLECARRFIAFDHEDRLAARHAPHGAVPDTPQRTGDLPGSTEGTLRTHSHLDYNRLTEHIAVAGEVVILNTWIPGIDILADALADALQRGTRISILLLHPESHVAQLRSQALQGATRARFHQDMVKPGIRHCLDVLAAVSQMVDESQRRHLRVRLYDSLPSISLYGVDERAFVSFFMHGHLAVKSPQIEMHRHESLMGRCAFEEMAALWSLGQELIDISRWRDETLDVAGDPVVAVSAHRGGRTLALQPHGQSLYAAPAGP